jgi:hypothetical protein
MFLNEVNERVLSEFMAHCFEDMQMVCPGLFEKVVRITQSTDVRYSDANKVRVIAVNVSDEAMPLPPVLVVFPTESDKEYFHIMINRDQAGGPQNKFTPEEITYIADLAKTTPFIYEIPDDILDSVISN